MKRILTLVATSVIGTLVALHSLPVLNRFLRWLGFGPARPEFPPYMEEL